MIAVDSTTKTTIIQSKQWGRLEIDEDEVICFNRGIPGFEHLCKFLQNYAIFCFIFSLFFLTHFTQTTHAASQHSLIDQKPA